MSRGSRAISLAVLGCTLAWAGAVPAATLVELFRLAVDRDAAFSSVQARSRAAQELVPQAQSQLLPHVQLLGGAGWVDHRHQGPLQRDRSDGNSYALVLTQPLLRWQAVVGREQGSLAGSAATIEQAAASQRLMLEVAQAYFDLLLAEDGLHNALTHREVLQAQQRKVTYAHDQGSATGLEVNELQAQADLAQARELDARDAVALSRENLRRLTGQVPDELAEIAEPVLLAPPSPVDIERWAQRARGDNLQVQLAELREQIASKEVEKRKAEHLPSVDLVAAYGRFDAGGGTLFGAQVEGREYDQSAVGLTLSLPLYAGGGTQSRVRQASALLESSGYDLLDAQRSAELDARRAYLQVVGGVNRYRALDHALQSAVSHCRSSLVAQDAGAATGNDVLLAQDHLEEARLRLAQLRHDLALGQLRLLAATGQLSAADLARFTPVAREAASPCQ